MFWDRDLSQKPCIPLKIYHWAAQDIEGHVRRGEITAPNQRLALSYLEPLALKNLKIRKSFRWKRISYTALSAFLKQFLTLYRAHFPLQQIIENLLHLYPRSPLTPFLNNCKNLIQEGYPLSYAFKKHGFLFDPLFCELITMGETTGKLENILEFILFHRKQMTFLKKKIQKALVYPAIVSFTACLVIGIFLLRVVPSLAALYQTMKVSLPLPTRMIIGIAHTFQHPGSLVTSLLLGILFLIPYQTKRLKSSSFLLSLPFFGSLLKTYYFTRFTALNYLTLSAGIPLFNALTLLKPSFHSTPLHRMIPSLQTSLEKGYSLHQAMSQNPVFAPFILQTISIGESTGQLDQSFKMLTEYYQSTLSETLERLTQWIEPVIMFALSIIIGSLVIALYLPIFKLGMVI